MENISVITYGRVSTDEQADSGFSLNHQEEMLKKYCDIKKYNVMKHYVEDYSAKNFNRPEWTKLMDYVKKNKKSIDMILFTKWDRFSRNIEGALTVIRQLSEMGIKVNSIEQPLDLSIPDNKVMLSMYLILPEVENDKNSQRTKEGMRRAKKEGCFMGKAPFGYSNAKILEKTSLEPNSDSKIALRAFEEVAKGISAVEVIRKRFKDEYGLKIKKQQFYNMLRNITYCGMIIIPEYQKEEPEIIRGLHEPIVDLELFKRVQNILDSRKNSDAKFPTNVSETFPLRGNFICSNCGKQITGSKSKGNGGRYEYYHCKSSCKIRLAKKTVHGMVQELLDTISLNENAKETFKIVLKDVIHSNHVDAKTRIGELETELQSTNKALETAQDKYIANELSSDDYFKFKKRYSDKISDIENRMDMLKENDTDLKKFVDNSVNLLCKLGETFNRLSNKDKGSFLRVIYPENIILENECFRTNSQNSIVELMTRFCKGLQSMEIKKATPKNGFSIVAPPLGLEPRTL